MEGRSRQFVEGFLDRRQELRRMSAALRRGESLLVAGPAGSGKSALVASAAQRLAPAEARATLALGPVEGLQDFLGELLHSLLRKRDPVLTATLRREGVKEDEFKAWLGAETSSHLKGVAYRAFERSAYRLILDPTPTITPAMARVLVELIRMRNGSLFLLTRDPSRPDLARLRDVYWTDEFRLDLGPLPVPEARQLVEARIQKALFDRLDLTSFRKQVLDLSKGLPGAIVQFAAMASEPRYRDGPRLRTELMQIDYLMGRRDPPRQCSNLTEGCRDGS
jgi:energy-coupling factor transporter ATP-binding protein EcfA2